MLYSEQEFLDFPKTFSSETLLKAEIPNFQILGSLWYNYKWTVR